MTRARGDSLTRAIASNWLGLALTVILAFFMSPFIVTKLGSTYYGIWALSLQFTGYLNLFDFGVREAVVRYTSKYAARNRSDELNRVLATAFLTYFPIVALAVLITGLCVWVVPRVFEIEPTYYRATRWAVLFAGLTISLNLLFNVFTGILMGLRRFDAANAINIVAVLVRAGVIVALLGAGYGLIALAATQFAFALLVGLATAFASAYLLRQRGLRFAPKLPRGRRLPAMARRILGYGTYALLHSIGQKIIFTSDAIVVGAFISVAAVTPYSIAGSLVQYLRTLLMSTVRVFVPATSELHARGEHEKLRVLIIRAARLAILIVLPVAIIYAILGHEFIRLWMGEEYATDASGVLIVLAVTQIFSAPSNVLVAALYGTSQHKLVSLLRLAEAGANVTLSIILAQTIGLVGVALGTAISHIFMVMIVMPNLVGPQLRFRATEYLVGAYVRPAIASLPLVAVTFLVRGELRIENLLSFIGIVVVLVAIYAVSVFLLGLNSDERRFVLRKIRRQ
jgi:O-antigen/teichoic acid export membrane protein